jgi:cytochrome c oxidase subunit 1
VTTSERLPRPVEVGRSQGYRKGSILADWLSSTAHKIIGHRYLITSFGFFLAGGIMAMIMRAQLMGPGHRIVSGCWTCPAVRLVRQQPRGWGSWCRGSGTG